MDVAFDRVKLRDLSTLSRLRDMREQSAFAKWRRLERIHEDAVQIEKAALAALVTTEERRRHGEVAVYTQLVNEAPKRPCALELSRAKLENLSLGVRTATGEVEKARVTRLKTGADAEEGRVCWAAASAAKRKWTLVEKEVAARHERRLSTLDEIETEEDVASRRTLGPRAGAL
jgi:hypothetical protein